MNIHLRLCWSILGLWAPLAVLAGCSGSQTPFVPGAPGLQSVAPGALSDSYNPTTIRPKTASFVYVASSIGCGIIRGTNCHAMVSVYKYPSGKYQGKWVDSTAAAAHSSTGGACADNLGHVFVTYSGASGKILEFAQGGSRPIAILGDPEGSPIACSVDPMTGNLAVVGTASTAQGSSSILIYHGAARVPTRYAASRFLSSVGYDNKGDAFVDGPTGLAELRKGATSFRKVTLDRNIVSFGSLQWDGKYMTVADFGTNVIYRFAPSEDGVESVVGGTPLNSGDRGLTQTWIVGDHVVGADYETRRCIDACPGIVKVWHYPQVSLLSQTIGVDFQDPSGVAVSLTLDPPK